MIGSGSVYDQRNENRERLLLLKEGIIRSGSQREEERLERKSLKGNQSDIIYYNLIFFIFLYSFL